MVSLSYNSLLLQARAFLNKSRDYLVVQALRCWDLLLALPNLRLVAIGAALYCLIPVLQMPWWQFQLLKLPATEVAQRTEAWQQFYQLHGDAMLPALTAQIQLNRLLQLQQQYEQAQQSFQSQRRDDAWAEATEFLISHVLSNQINNNQINSNQVKGNSINSGATQSLVMNDVDCRNTLCRVELQTAQGLTPSMQQQILQFAAILKTADLEFKDLSTKTSVVTLEFESSKALQLGFFAHRRVYPAERDVWETTLRQWLYAPAADSTEMPDATATTETTVTTEAKL